MTATAPSTLTRQQLINLLSQHKQEWQRLYGIQHITMFGSLARDQGNASSDVDLLTADEIKENRRPFLISSLVHGAL